MECYTNLDYDHFFNKKALSCLKNTLFRQIFRLKYTKNDNIGPSGRSSCKMNLRFLSLLLVAALLLGSAEGCGTIKITATTSPATRDPFYDSPFWPKTFRTIFCPQI
jgi:hypothetical protein